MRFVYYTDKSVAQCMTALNARMQAKPSASRPALDGWVEKSGGFSLSTSCRVARYFTRRTHLRAAAIREEGLTVIRGYVPDGASREGQAVIFGALLLVCLALVGSGNSLPAVIVVLAAAALYIPLTGDHANSAILLSEVQKTLGAKATPPKQAAKTNRARSTVSQRVR